MAALSRAERERHEQLALFLKGEAFQMQELTHGFAFLFAPSVETAQLLTEFMTLERLCCPFLELRVSFAPAQGPLSLTLSGPEGVKPFLVAELSLGSS